MNNLTPFIENFNVATTSLLSSKLRTFLTTIGIGIGIAAVIILISLGQGVRVYITKQFLSLSANLIYVRPITADNNGPGTPQNNNKYSTLTMRDVRILQDPFNLPNVRRVVPLLQISATTEYGSSTVHTSVLGTTPLYFPTLNRTVASGRLFTDQDLDENARVVVIGQTTAKNLFYSGENPIGETIRIGDVGFKVIGVLQKAGSGGFGSDQDDTIIVPQTTAQVRLQSARNYNGEMPLSQIYLEAESDSAIDNIVSAATTLMRREHKIKAGDDNDFEVTSQRDTLSVFNSIITILTLFLGVIGGISLLVGGIGVMNIMLVTVTERTREIGLRKAVGARGQDVLFQFLTEATVLCFVGSAAGLAVALVFSLLVRLFFPDLDASISLQSVALAVGITTFIGIFFGLYPASRAAALSPIQALRSE